MLMLKARQLMHLRNGCRNKNPFAAIETNVTDTILYYTENGD